DHFFPNQFGKMSVRLAPLKETIERPIPADRKVEYLPEGKLKELRDIANALVAPGKGLLAADESVRKSKDHFNQVV
ncbi:uncharacterized protein DEA37_0002249, partial [Paragonimus westermani]